MSNFEKLSKAIKILTVYFSIPLIVLLCLIYVLLLGQNIPKADTHPNLYQLFILLQNVCAGLIPVFILFIGSHLILDRFKDIKRKDEKDSLLKEIQDKFEVVISSGEFKNKLSETVKLNTFSALDEFKNADQFFSPFEIYYNKKSELLLRQKREFGSTDKYSFMSTSGVNFLNNAVEEIDETVTLKIHLLLMNPGIEKNIEARYAQLKKYEEEKTPKYLKEEIIRSIYKAIQICNQKEKVEVHICLHDEAPLFRFEFVHKEAYLSYYYGQESREMIGPVGVFLRGSIVYKAYTEYFEDVWKRSQASYCLLIKKESSISDVRDILLEMFHDCNNGICDIIMSSCKDYCEKIGSNRCIRNCPNK